MYNIIIIISMFECNNILYVGKFWRGKILANGWQFAKIFPRTVYHWSGFRSTFTPVVVIITYLTLNHVDGNL